MNNATATQRVLIVGGGTAGWLTACVLAAEHGQYLDVTLIESPDVPTIGVGEGTWPSMRSTLQKIGIDETDVLHACNASFKQGTQFVNWLRDDQPHTYYHPFSLPADYANTNLAEYWLDAAVGDDFGSFVTPQIPLMARGYAPKTADVPAYAFKLNYGYHFDAAAFAALLSNHARKRLGIKHRQGRVSEVIRSDGGDIKEIRLEHGESIHADLYVDCSGQHALLMQGTSWISLTETSPNNRALVVQVAHRDDQVPIPSYTRSHATDQGWIWDIALQNRRGVGFVHSDSHSSEEDAWLRLDGYLHENGDPGLNSLNPRMVNFEAGYRPSPWQGNSVAIGLSAGFIEPLEASAIALIEQAAMMLTDALPLARERMDLVAADFNARMRSHWSTIAEFLKLHYVLSHRAESDYWQVQRRKESIPDSLVDKLERWRYRPIWHVDAPRFDELFPSASYQYIAYGMGFRPALDLSRRTAFQRKRGTADNALHRVREMTRQLANDLPSNRTLLNQLMFPGGGSTVSGSAR